MPEDRNKMYYRRMLEEQYPGYLETLGSAALARLLREVEAAAKQDLQDWKFLKAVRGLKSYEAWSASTELDVPPPEVEPDPEAEPEPEPEPETEEPGIDTDIRDLLVGFLRENELPESLIGFITDSLAQKKSYAQIVAELRQTDEYKSSYPENFLRQENGLSWMSEAEIRGMRDEIKRLSQEYLGVQDVSPQEYQNIIGKGWSLRTWETKLQRFQEFERWGPTVRMVLESELGYAIDDERLYAFFDETPTADLDRAYEKALLRGQPAILGLGVRPEDEAEILRRYGIAPEQAFRGYQELARELPRSERLGLIEGEIGRNLEQFPTGTELFADTPFATLFRAVQLQDTEAIATLQGQMSREVARWQGQGGAATTNAGSVGLLSEEERNAS